MLMRNSIGKVSISEALPKDARKKYQNAVQMKNFLQNVVGTDEHGVLQGQPGQQPVGKGATSSSDSAREAALPLDPNTPCP